jgi:hypothetical protein
LNNSNSRSSSSSSNSTVVIIFAIMLIIAVSFSANTNTNTNTNIIDASSSSSKKLSLFVSAATDECADGDISTETFTNGKTNEVFIMCQWAAAAIGTKNSNKKHKKKQKKKQKRLNKKRCRKKKRGNYSGKFLAVIDECPCACSRFITIIDDASTPPVDEPATEQCPIESEATMLNSVCLPKYKDQLKCEYDYIWMGSCTEPMHCGPIISCTCNELFGVGDDKWTCRWESLEACPTAPPTPRTRPESRSLFLLLNNLHNKTTGKEEEEELPRQSRNLIQGERGTSCDPATDPIYVI